MVIRWDDFSGRKPRTDIVRIYETNPFAVIRVSQETSLEDFGGMPYEDWLQGKPFPPKSEMRKFTCPAQWFNGKIHFSWDTCTRGSFSLCAHYAEKDKCWERWDTEQEGKVFYGM